MSHWVRFDHNNEVGFGKVDGQQIEVYAGDMFAEASSKKQKLAYQK